MSTPMFIREPDLGTPSTGITGNNLGDASFIDITNILTEAMLVEEVNWSAKVFSTLAGQIVLRLKDGSGTTFNLGMFQAQAGTSTQYACGRIPLNITIPVGYKLTAAHNVTVSGPSFADLCILPLGGIVR